MILPLPAFIYTPPAQTEAGRNRQDRRMTRDLGTMALATCVLTGMLMSYLVGPTFAIAAISGALAIAGVGGVVMERWKVSASSVVLGAMAFVLAAFAIFAWTAL